MTVRATLRKTSLLAPVAALLVATGCYTTSPQLWETSNETFAYDSTCMQPVTITLVDIRTEQPFFRIDIPVGKRLAFHFDETGGDDPVVRPAKLSWAIFEPNAAGGSLTNTQSAPPQSSRRIDFSIRPAPEYPPDAAQAEMRVNGQPNPQWTTQQGGPAPTPNSKKLYQ